MRRFEEAMRRFAALFQCPAKNFSRKRSETFTRRAGNGGRAS
jgi:hypothetical protein